MRLKSALRYPYLFNQCNKIVTYLLLLTVSTFGLFSQSATAASDTEKETAKIALLRQITLLFQAHKQLLKNH